MSGSPWLAEGQKSEHIEFAVTERLTVYTIEQRREFIGRLVNLLAEKGVISASDIGNLFYEDWE